MARAATLDLSWNTTGHINHTIPRGYNDPTDNLNLVLAPSLPLLLSHQLGTLRPSHGLILCGQALDYYTSGRHTTYPINSSLTRATIQFHSTPRGITITFHPKGRFMAPSDSIEEGVRQLLNNYVPYVCSKVTGTVLHVVRALSGSTIEWYLTCLEEELSRGAIGSSRDAWNPRFSAEMATNSSTIASSYGTEAPPGTDIAKITADLASNFVRISQLRDRLSATMGITNGA